MSLEDDEIERVWSREPDAQTDPRTELRMRIVEELSKLHPKKYCWTDLVMWAYEMRAAHRGIITAPECLKFEGGTCYCGAWVDGKFLADRNREEVRRDKVVERLINGPAEDDGLPF